MVKLSKNDSILLLGSNGMVGSAVLRLLRSKGISKIYNPTFDLTKQGLLDNYLSTMIKDRPTIVIMCAAVVGGIVYNSENMFYSFYQNTVMSLNVINECRKNGVYRIVFLGSSCIYPRDCPQPIKEEYLLTSPLESTNEGYALAKINGIKMLEYCSKSIEKEHQYISLMPCNLLGIGDRYHPRQSHVIPALIQKFHKAKIENAPYVELMGSGTVFREFMDADDLAEAIVFCLENIGYGYNLINVGNDDNEVTISQLAEIIKSVVRYEGEIRFLNNGMDGTPRKKLDTSKLTQLGWTSKTKLMDALHKAYDYYLTNSNIILFF